MPRASILALVCALAGLCLAPACQRGSELEIVELVDAAGVDPEVIELAARHVRRVREAPRDAEQRARLAMVYEANELWEEARRSWISALALRPDVPHWRYHLSICTRQAGDSEESLRLLREVVDRLPRLAAARHRLGDMLLESGDVSGARQEFQAAIDLEPNRPNAYVGLAEVMLREEEYERARELCERALSMSSGYKRAHYNLGLAWRGLGDRDKAQEHLSLGLNAQKDFLDDPLAADVAAYKRSYVVRVLEANNLERAGRPDAARAILEEVYRKHPDELVVLNNLAAVYLQLDRLPEAMTLLERALVLDPAAFATYTNLATAELARGNLEEALRHAERAVELSQSVGHAWFTRARVLVALSRPSEAYRDLNKAVELDSTRWLPYAYLGDVAITLRLYDLAVEHFQACLRLKPDHLPAAVRLSWALDRIGRRDDALAAFERAKALAPGNPEIGKLAQELGLASR